jgi:peroxiredoxin Q/BCP
MQVSSDSVERQKQFSDKHKLGYTLLADTEKKVREAYGVGGTALLGLAARTFFACSYLASMIQLV